MKKELLNEELLNQIRLMKYDRSKTLLEQEPTKKEEKQIERKKKKCIKKGGTWNEKLKKCFYPKATPGKARVKQEDAPTLNYEFLVNGKVRNTWTKVKLAWPDPNFKRGLTATDAMMFQNEQVDTNQNPNIWYGLTTKTIEVESYYNKDVCDEVNKNGGYCYGPHLEQIGDLLGRPVYKDNATMIIDTNFAEIPWPGYCRYFNQAVSPRKDTPNGYCAYKSPRGLSVTDAEMHEIMGYNFLNSDLTINLPLGAYIKFGDGEDSSEKYKKMARNHIVNLFNVYSGTFDNPFLYAPIKNIKQYTEKISELYWQKLETIVKNEFAPVCENLKSLYSNDSSVFDTWNDLSNPKSNKYNSACASLIKKYNAQLNTEVDNNRVPLTNYMGKNPAWKPNLTKEQKEEISNYLFDNIYTDIVPPDKDQVVQFIMPNQDKYVLTMRFNSNDGFTYDRYRKVTEFTMDGKNLKHAVYYELNQSGEYAGRGFVGSTYDEPEWKDTRSGLQKWVDEWGVITQLVAAGVSLLFAFFGFVGPLILVFEIAVEGTLAGLVAWREYEKGNYVHSIFSALFGLLPFFKMFKWFQGVKAAPLQSLISKMKRVGSDGLKLEMTEAEFMKFYRSLDATELDVLTKLASDKQTLKLIGGLKGNPTEIVKYFNTLKNAGKIKTPNVSIFATTTGRELLANLSVLGGEYLADWLFGDKLNNEQKQKIVWAYHIIPKSHRTNYLGNLQDSFVNNTLKPEKAAEIVVKAQSMKGTDTEQALVAYRETFKAIEDNNGEWKGDKPSDSDYNFITETPEELTKNGYVLATEENWPPIGTELIYATDENFYYYVGDRINKEVENNSMDKTELNNK